MTRHQTSPSSSRLDTHQRKTQLPSAFRECNQAFRRPLTVPPGVPPPVDRTGPRCLRAAAKTATAKTPLKKRARKNGGSVEPVCLPEGRTVWGGEGEETECCRVTQGQAEVNSAACDLDKGGSTASGNLEQFMSLLVPLNACRFCHFPVHVGTWKLLSSQDINENVTERETHPTETGSKAYRLSTSANSKIQPNPTSRRLYRRVICIS